jgi:hypothetical protein
MGRSATGKALLKESQRHVIRNKDLAFLHRLLAGVIIPDAEIYIGQSVYIKILSRMLYGIVVHAGLVGNLGTIPHAFKFEDALGIVNVDPLEFFDPPVMVRQVGQWVLHAEAEMYELVHAEHFVGIKAMLVTAGVEIDAPLPQLGG